jgi:hypothetical protein
VLPEALSGLSDATLKSLTIEATSAHRTKEVDATRTMIDRVQRRFALKPTRLIGDMTRGGLSRASAFGRLMQQTDTP